MNEAVKIPYCHQCGTRHWKNEDCNHPRVAELKEEIEELLEEEDCPVCAERRKKKAARMKRWRDKRRAKS
jgi:hypothetical protein